VISTFKYREGKKTNIILQEQQYSCSTDLYSKLDGNAWVLILTTPLEKKIIQEPNFCHYSCKNLAKKIASWCHGIMSQNNDTSVK
jgi:hypothetical protein